MTALIKLSPLVGRWPEATQAFKKMKAALGVQLAEELFTGFGIRADATEEYIDTFTDGFVFRLYLCSDRYIPLSRQIPSQVTLAHQSTSQSLPTEKHSLGSLKAFTASTLGTSSGKLM